MASRSNGQRTLMAVHAHPDDESSSTGGILARYSAAGVRTVVVTCTNGEYGDAPQGLKPGQDGHDPQQVAALRLSELQRAVEVLGVSHHHLLGYHDSGMPDWPYRERPEAFCNVPVSIVAGQLVELMEQYQPDVVVTYDQEGGYLHPDHLHAAACTLEAVRLCGIPQRVYLTAHRVSDWRNLFSALTAAGVAAPDTSDWDAGAMARMEEAERRITAGIDVTSVLHLKRKALACHASQLDDSWMSAIPDEIAATSFGKEYFIEVGAEPSSTLAEDLFGGLQVAAV